MTRSERDMAGMILRGRAFDHAMGKQHGSRGRGFRVSYQDGSGAVRYWCGYGNGEQGQGWTDNPGHASEYSSAEAAELVARAVCSWTGRCADAHVAGDYNQLVG